MRFESYHAIDHMNTGLLELFGPDNVVSLIKAREDFDQNRDLLLIQGSTYQGLDDRGVAGGSVEGHFDGHHIGIIGRLTDERFNRAPKGFIGVMDEDIALPYLFKESAGIPLRGATGMKGQR